MPGQGPSARPGAERAAPASRKGGAGAGTASPCPPTRSRRPRGYYRAPSPLSLQGRFSASLPLVTSRSLERTAVRSSTCRSFPSAERARGLRGSVRPGLRPLLPPEPLRCGAGPACPLRPGSAAPAGGWAAPAVRAERGEGTLAPSSLNFSSLSSAPTPLRRAAAPAPHRPPAACTNAAVDPRGGAAAGPLGQMRKGSPQPFPLAGAESCRPAPPAPSRPMHCPSSQDNAEFPAGQVPCARLWRVGPGPPSANQSGCGGEAAGGIAGPARRSGQGARPVSFAASRLLSCVPAAQHAAVFALKHMLRGVGDLQGTSRHPCGNLDLRLS